LYTPFIGTTSNYPHSIKEEDKECWHFPEGWGGGGGRRRKRKIT